jgi:hypothetical protein
MNNEFKKSKSNNETRYTLESMTAGATGSGSVATATGSLGKVQKRENILAQEADKKKDAPKPRNFVAKNAKMGGAGQHADKKKAEKQGSVKHKKPYMESLRSQIDQLKSKLAEQGVAEGESSMFSKVMGHETTPEAARQIQQQGFKKSHTGIFFNVGNQNYSGGGYGGTVVMAKVSGPIDDILNLEDDNDLPDNLDDFADGEEIANYAREEGYWAWTDGVQFAVLDPRHIQVVKEGVAEGSNDNEGSADKGAWREAWLKQRAYERAARLKQQSNKKKPPTPVNKNKEKGVAEGEGTTQKYEMMMRNGQVKKFIAKDDADAKRIAAGHGAKSVIKLRGGVPAGKIAEQGVAEGPPKDPNAPKLVQDRKTGKWYDPNKEFAKKMNSPEVMAQMKRMAQKEGVEDRTSYQVAKILSDRGIKYDPAQENELINAIGMVLVKDLNMTPKQARYLISYDEDFVSDTLGELGNMENAVSEVDVYMESLAHSLQQVLSEKAVSKKQQKFMGMVHAAQKGEKPASKEVAKVAKDMGKKDAKDFASTKHKGLPEKKKSKK